MTVAITSERSVDLWKGLLERHVLWVHGDNRCLTPETPQEPLLSKAPPGPSQDPVLYRVQEANPGFSATALACRARPAAPLLPVLDLAKCDDEILPDPAKHTDGGDLLRELGVARDFAIQLVAIPTSGDHKNIHQY